MAGYNPDGKNMSFFTNNEELLSALRGMGKSDTYLIASLEEQGGYCFKVGLQAPKGGALILNGVETKKINPDAEYFLVVDADNSFDFVDDQTCGKKARQTLKYDDVQRIKEEFSNHIIPYDSDIQNT